MELFLLLVIFGLIVWFLPKRIITWLQKQEKPLPIKPEAYEQLYWEKPPYESILGEVKREEDSVYKATKKRTSTTRVRSQEKKQPSKALPEHKVDPLDEYIDKLGMTRKQYYVNVKKIHGMDKEQAEIMLAKILES